MLDLFTKIEDYGDRLKVKVTPKASSNRIKVEHQTDGSKLIRVYVTTAPEDGKANDMVIALLAKALKISKSSLRIVQGHKIRDKIIEIVR